LIPNNLHIFTCPSRNEYKIRTDLFVARFPCPANTCCCRRCGLGGGSESTCPSFSIQVVPNVLWGDKDKKHEESSEQVQNAGHDCKVLCSDILVEKLAKNHADGLQAPRNAKDEEELAIEDHLFLKFICGLVLISDDAVSLGVKYPANNDGEEEGVEEYNAKDGEMVEKENSCQRFS